MPRRSKRSNSFPKPEGIIPALESSHALAHAAKVAASMNKEQLMIINLSGRG